MKTFVFGVFACFIFFQSSSQSPQVIVPFRLGNKWGYSDTLGKIKIKPKYDSVSLFDYDMVYKGNHVFAEVKLNGKPMMINEQGAVVVPPKYDYIKLIDGLEEATFIISKNNKFGLFAKGKELFPPVSDWMADAYPGRFYEVHTNGKSGLINMKGEIVIPIIYDRLHPAGGKTPGFMDWQCVVYGKEPELRTVELPKENWNSQRIPEVETIDYMSDNNIDKIIDSATKEFGFDSIQLKYQAAVAYKGDKRGIILPDATKKVYLFSKPYDIYHIKYFPPNSRSSWNKNSASYIIASLDGKYGMINEREEQVLPFEYDGIENSNGFFLLKQNNKIGFFIWNTVYPVIQPAYDEYIGERYIPVNNRWRFTLFKIIKNGRTGFVGENGVAYFKD
jgi:hypothetical protein